VIAPKRGEVWLVDLGMAAKVRPALVLSIPANDEDRALATLVPHTTSVRGSRFEAAVSAAFLKAGAQARAREHRCGAPAAERSR
jgi:mRNA interferase MazF